MSQSRSSLAEYAASNSPFSQFRLESRVNANAHQAYNTFVSTEQRGLSVAASASAHILPAVMANAFPSSLPSVMPFPVSPTFSLQAAESIYPVATSNANLEARSNIAYENFKVRQAVDTSHLPEALEKSSRTAMTITGVRAANHLVEGLGSFIKHKLRFVNLTFDIYDRTNTAVDSGMSGTTSFVCGALGGISKTVTTVTGYGFVITEGLIVAGSTLGYGLIPATIFFSASLPAVDMLSNGIGDAVETACQNVVGGSDDMDKPDELESASQKNLELNVIQHELFIMSLDAIRKAVPDDLSTCDYPTLKNTSEAVSILKDMVKGMQMNGLKTSDVELGDLSQEMNLIEDKFNNMVRECVLKRIQNQSVSINSSALFSRDRQLPVATITAFPLIKKL